ncbi:MULTISPECIES: DUF4258 domain-containing protein [Roseiflexus]|jgi:hypothetical protein|uniref:DUF4258 domain-containing protein n=1 Tax=Roseiflexus castenholzii (strain DSM 13941 / HLO8) TaxID=383372 RepID=A7NG17_ROSCS|nr:MULTISPECIES: DUF4258 domain-containing protein [Roseiflexus]ABU56404.1 hypothetical protein Rcas_0271 [Roseiflexus castenholzii DSM 13941]GIV99463.1 MAG: hypothetical protein KatS3mg058_0867 [Roseiflexus sp.]
MTNAQPIAHYRISEHARNEMSRRQISESEITSVLAAPEQVEIVREGRAVYQSRFQIGDPPKLYLVRVFVDVDVIPPVVVTVYRTSKVAKYWGKE